MSLTNDPTGYQYLYLLFRNIPSKTPYEKTGRADPDRGYRQVQEAVPQQEPDHQSFLSNKPLPHSQHQKHKRRTKDLLETYHIMYHIGKRAYSKNI